MSESQNENPRSRGRLRQAAKLVGNRNAVNHTIVKVADFNSWTGRHIAALVKMYAREFDGKPVDEPLLAKLEVCIEYLYLRGRDGRGSRCQTIRGCQQPGPSGPQPEDE